MWLRVPERYLTRLVILLTVDAIAIAVSYLGAIALRYSNQPLLGFSPQLLTYLPLELGAGLVIFAMAKMYRTLWRYASVDALFVVAGGTLGATAVPAAVILLWGRIAPDWSVFIIQWLLLFLIVGGGRFSIRLIRLLHTPGRSEDKPRVLIYGAGDAGEMISRDVLRSREQHFTIVGFIDDDAYKHGKSLHGLPILGGLKQVAEIAESKRVDELVVAMPSIPGSEMRRILNYLRSQLKARVQLKTVPGISELIKGMVTFGQVRQFDVRDLLRRSAVELDPSRVERLIRGRSVLVSGAGGSIGSEICRQVAVCQPGKLVAYDISEPSLYAICEQLGELFPDLELVPIVGDIAHRRLVKRVFNDHSPQIIFHAAAYKHVPLMQLNPWAAVFNNVTGTRVLLSAAAEHDVERFVMISTDKAVRPTSVMGATKRLCEMMVQAQPHSLDSVYSVVRFGNVMGSSGSVIPKFEHQIRSGGPVTVTHREATRYFMLTSEAVQLVMQAATLNHPDAVYILDMGDPIRIDDLARDMIQLYGYEPGKGMEIVYTGLRPGEKLHEELYHKGSGVRTEIDKIWLTDSPRFDVEGFNEELDELLESCYSLARDKLLQFIRKLVTDFNLATEGIALRAQPIGTDGSRARAPKSSGHSVN